MATVVVELPISMVPFAGAVVVVWFVPATVVVVFIGTVMFDAAVVVFIGPVVFDAAVPLAGTKVS